MMTSAPSLAAQHSRKSSSSQPRNFPTDSLKNPGEKLHAQSVTHREDTKEETDILCLTLSSMRTEGSPPISR